MDNTNNSEIFDAHLYINVAQSLMGSLTDKIDVDSEEGIETAIINVKYHGNDISNICFAINYFLHMAKCCAENAM